jgi:hypothetical protein
LPTTRRWRLDGYRTALFGTRSGRHVKRQPEGSWPTPSVPICGGVDSQADGSWVQVFTANPADPTQIVLQGLDSFHPNSKGAEAFADAVIEATGVMAGHWLSHFPVRL